MNIETLSNLNKNIVLFVYQLIVFSESEHHFIHIIISQCCDFFQFIIKHYIKFFLSQHFFLSSYSTSENSIFQRKTLIDFDFLESQIS